MTTETRRRISPPGSKANVYGVKPVSSAFLSCKLSTKLFYLPSMRSRWTECEKRSISETDTFPL